MRIRILLLLAWSLHLFTLQQKIHTPTTFHVPTTGYWNTHTHMYTQDATEMAEGVQLRCDICRYPLTSLLWSTTMWNSTHTKTSAGSGTFLNLWLVNYYCLWQCGTHMVACFLKWVWVRAQHMTASSTCDYLSSSCSHLSLLNYYYFLVLNSSLVHMHTFARLSEIW